MSIGRGWYPHEDPDPKEFIAIELLRGTLQNVWDMHQKRHLEALEMAKKGDPNVQQYVDNKEK